MLNMLVFQNLVVLNLVLVILTTSALITYDQAWRMPDMLV